MVVKTVVPTWGRRLCRTGVLMNLAGEWDCLF
jgi:hypothetical protein